MTFNFQYKFTLAILLAYVHIFAAKESISNSGASENIRIITDQEIIKGTEGVPIEYWYNETSSDQEYTSSPGCPQSIDGYPWVYYGSPPRCFLAGVKGPCLLVTGMTLQTGSLYGVCACQCFTESVEYRLQLPDTSSGYIQCADPYREGFSQIYDKENEKCYFVGQSGPCPIGKVVARLMNDTNTLTCLPPCNKTISNWRELEEQGVCATGKTSRKTGAASIQEGDCPPGKEHSSKLGKCIISTNIRSRTLG